MELSRLQIEKIIEDQLLDIHFQPIVSPKSQAVVGVEALMRCFMGDNGYIPPDMLFAWAAQKGLALQLDRLCREKAMEKFAAVQRIQSDLRLFINIESSIINKHTVGSGNIIDAANHWGIRPQDVVIEINEAKVADAEELRRFVQLHRGYGFSLALDDIGYGHSNLDRITHVQPDILKIDRSLCKDLDKDHYKQEIFKSLIGLACRTGALVVAEGVETKAEVLMAMGLGVDMVQGYYFAHPAPVTEPIRIVCTEVVDAYRQQYLRKIKLETVRRQRMKEILVRVIKGLWIRPMRDFEQGLRDIMLDAEELEFLYILDQQGGQITATVGNDLKAGKGEWPFRKAECGTDQSLKPYYLHVQGGEKLYISEPYRSAASGELCITCSVVFSTKDKESYILCADFKQK